MTVKELKEQLESYDDDTEIVFKVCDDFEPDSVTEYKCGNREVHLDARVKPSFICRIYREIHIIFGKDNG